MDTTWGDAEAAHVNEGMETYTGLENLTDNADDNDASSVDVDSDCDHGLDEDHENDIEGECTENCLDDGITINGMVDILKIDMKNISNDDVRRLDFADMQVAYEFYNWYARMNGFSVRKSQVLKNNKGEKLQQTFVCSREGFRQNRGLTNETRRREERQITRCGCGARFRVHIDINSCRWYVTVFNDEHNHELLEEKYCALLPAHRKLSAADILQIGNFSTVGIKPSQMYSSLANNAGGYEKVGFRKKDIYNQVSRQKRQQTSDATGALKYLRHLGLNDPLMFFRHTVDDEGRLQHLFWCDGESQMNYKVFGDVLAFDATYKNNKYLCPLVVFSGVNHHNQTIVFATALVSNETEDTYAWLLEQFMLVMKGKAPSSVITDGDIAMKNAISRVFPNAHHRLCAWHLLRNAISHVGIPEFMPYFKKCMLGDFDVVKFEQMWVEMVAKFGLEDNNWITEMYEKRKMWATAHMRGNFFAGIRTTSRCEALHSHIKKFVHSRLNLTGFVQQYHRCLTYFRFREVEADFQSDYGQAVLQTSLRSIERSASRHLTKEIFCLFRAMLTKASLIRVMECQEMTMSLIYSVSKYRGRGTVWHVSYCPSLIEFRCSCLRMESIGLPCDHILGVLVYLDFSELPKSLILDRWTKCAKEVIRGTYTEGSLYWDSHLVARYATLVQLSREVSELAYRDEEDYNHFVELLTGELGRLKIKYSDGGDEHNPNPEIQSMQDTLQDPPCVRTKGCGSSATIAGGRSKRTQRCRGCGATGHNRRSCQAAAQTDEVDPTPCTNWSSVEDIGAREYDDDTNRSVMHDDPQSFIPSSSRTVHNG